MNSKIFVIFALTLSGPIIAADGMPLFRDGTASSVIVVEGATHEYAAEELQKYLTRLGGTNVPIITPADVSKVEDRTSLILLGGPSENPIVREIVERGLVDFEGLGDDGFLLRTVSVDRRKMAVVGGNNEPATLYAVYDLLERLGAVFLLSKDILPEAHPNLTLPSMDVRQTTPFSRRGIMVSNIYLPRGIMHLAEVKELLDQMVKLKLNYLQWFWFPTEPWIEYEYSGEKKLIGDATGKETGYLAWRYHYGSHLTKDLPVGSELYPDRPRMAPREFQNVETPADAYRVAESFLTEVIRHAKKRNIDVWLGIDPTTVPANLARYGRVPENRTRFFDMLVGTPMCPGDPVLHQINENRLRALANTYPEAEGFLLFLPEQYVQCSHPDDRQVVASEREHLAEIRSHLPTTKNYGGIFKHEDTVIDSIAGSVYIARKMIEARDRVAPGVRLGVVGLGHAYVLPALDKIFPKDIVFSDMESSAVWTPDGVPMRFFGGMGNRERTIIPRGDDDGQMYAPQFNVDLYFKDRLIEGAFEHGASGFASQTNRIRGNEHNIQYLSEAAWEPHLNPDTFYERYVRRLYGSAAADDALVAYKLLAENEEYLGWRGHQSFRCCGVIAEVEKAYQLYKHSAPFSGPPDAWKDFLAESPELIDIFSNSVEMLRNANVSLEAASAKAPRHAQYELRYLHNKTESYALMLEALIASRKGYLAFDNAFRLRAEQKSSRDEFVRTLDKAMGFFTDARILGRRSTEKFAQFVDHPSDLGVLYRANLFLVTGLELAEQTIRNVVEYYHGRYYTVEVPWHRIYVDFPSTTRND